MVAAVVVVFPCSTMATKVADPPDWCGMLCGPVEDPQNPQVREEDVHRLQDYFQKAVGAGRITQCASVLEEGFGHGFTAVGGACEIAIGRKKSLWLVCGDDGVGNFTAVVGERYPKAAVEQLPEFLKTHCVGG